MNSRLRLAISEFSKGRWAAEPSDEPPLHPTELNLATKVLSWLGKLAPLTFARYLITFFIGAIAVLASNLDLLRQSIDKLAAEIIEVEAAEEDILDKVSTAPPAATAVRNSVPRSSQARP